MRQRQEIQAVLRPLRSLFSDRGSPAPQQLHSRKDNSSIPQVSIIWGRCGSGDPRSGRSSAILAFAILGFAVSVPAGYVPTTLVPPAVQREFRGAWVATLNNIDWPSKPGLKVAEQKEELLRILDRASEIHLNAILLQVRPGCDAFYDSKLEPWSEYITGKMGLPPAPWYDPLALAIEEAHKRGLELHAWFNPFRARHVSATNAPAANHISKTNPQLVRAYGKDLWLDPGEAAARDHTIAVILDVVKRYDVDGVVMDDYFYPYQEKNREGKVIDFPDWPSWNRYHQSGGKLSRDDWRRENINSFMERLYSSVKAEKEYVKVGVSPFGIWRTKYPSQIKGLDAYKDLYADSRLWLQAGWVDYFAPQLYWPIDAPNQSFPVLLRWWVEQNTKERNIWAAGTLNRTNYPPQQIVDQVMLTRRQSGASGNIHFGFKMLLRNSGGMADALLKGVYSDVALAPAAPWLSNTRAAPVKLEVQDQWRGIFMEWQADPNMRFWLLQTRSTNRWSAQILPASQTRHTIKEHPEIVAITGIDKYGTASRPASVARVVKR